jgi:colanic acid biosynthesis glycosyl transferase WcaI
MRILVLSINYAPEPTGFAPHVTALCEHLAENNHAVSVLTGFPFAPYWRRWPEYGRGFITRTRIRGVDVSRVAHFIPRHPGRALQRVLMEATFCGMAALALFPWIGSRWDIILYVGAQPSLAMLARGLSALWRIPYALAINDLAAQAAIDVGIVRASWILRVLASFEYAAYRKADGAIVLCDAFRKALVERGFPADRIRLIRSPVNIEKIKPSSEGLRFRAEHGLSAGEFVVLYAGSMGIKQGLLHIVEAARLLREKAPRLRWVLVGDGELRQAVAQRIREYHVEEEVRMLPLQAEEEMAPMFAAADVLLLNQLASVKDTVIPSKLLTYMAAGRAVVAAVNAESQGAAMLRESGGGVVVAPEDASVLADAIQRWMADPSSLAPMGRNNRSFAEQHFDQRKIVSAQEAFLMDIVNRSRRSGERR